MTFEENEEQMRNKRGTNEEPMRTPREYKNDKNDKNKEEHVLDFQIFWDSFPRKASRKRSEQAWEKLKPDKELLERILALHPPSINLFESRTLER